ncbi:thiamine ABC transporter substrate binding subunit [Kytococcus sedentarius]|uniref:thiamine ABC transporter substrate-binding protein n=1 Tax=Kytococcus sedentarius TaxID=1276 RepID=UPI0035BBCBB7
MRRAAQTTRPQTTRPLAITVAVTASLALGGCSLGGGAQQDESGGSSEETADGGETTGGGGGSADASGSGAPSQSSGSADDKDLSGRTVSLVTHDSFNPPEGALEAFTERTGIEVKVLKSGDAGSLTNKLVLTADNPLGDAVFGIDNTFGGRALDEGVVAEHGLDLPEGVADHAMEADGGARLAPVDAGDVCVNIDDTWFEKEGINPPTSLDDLTKPEYKGLFVTPGASTSSPGLAFLLATIGEKGEDGWEQYWKDLVANDVKVTAGWEDAYTVDFTAGGGNGDRPIVLSYASSPPFTVPEGGDEPTTSALLDTCFRQVEYAGVLEGAKEPEAAAKVVEFLLGEEFQTGLPDAMYVYPVRQDVELPEAWEQWAPPAEEPIEVDAARIQENREDWLLRWSEAAGQ